MFNVATSVTPAPWTLPTTVEARWRNWQVSSLLPLPNAYQLPPLVSGLHNCSQLLLFTCVLSASLHSVMYCQTVYSRMMAASSNLLSCIRTVMFHSTLHHLQYSRPVNRVKGHDAYWNSYFPCWFFARINCSAICSYLLSVCNCVQPEDGWTWAETCRCVDILTIKNYVWWPLISYFEYVRYLV
jgi:hypothetical protein